MRLNISICDDEGIEVTNLKSLVEIWLKTNSIEANIVSFSNGHEMLGYVKSSNKFDIVFLDIYIGNHNGIEIARTLRSIDKTCRIIFVTNSQHHAIESYGVQAIHYLLKPVTLNLLGEALTRCINSIEKQNAQFIEVSNQQGIYKCFYADIIYADSRGRIVTIHTNKKNTISYYARLDNFEKACNDDRFLRCHQSYLVNMDYIANIIDNSIILNNDTRIQISKKASEIKKKFTAYLAKKMTD